MARTLTNQPSNKTLSELVPASGLEKPQPGFTKNLIDRLKNPAIATATRISVLSEDTSRMGDILAEDLFPDAIRSLHVRDLSADKLTAGTINTDEITISSEDGTVQIIGNLISIDNESDVRQITFGNYTGSNWGIAIGDDPDNPDIELTASWMRVHAASFVDMRDGSDITFRNSGNTVTSLIGYIINNFVIQGDSTNGINLNGNVTLGATAGEFGGGSSVIYIPNSSSVPSSDPTSGVLFFSENGALRARAPNGTRTTLIPSGIRLISSADSPYSVINADLYVSANAASGAITVNLPTAASNECRVIHIKKIDTSANVVTVAAGGSDDIEGVASLTLPTQFESVALYSNGSTRWHIQSLT